MLSLIRVGAPDEVIPEINVKTGLKVSGGELLEVIPPINAKLGLKVSGATLTPIISVIVKTGLKVSGGEVYAETPPASATYTTFIARFPEFADTAVYSFDRVSLFLSDAALTMGSNTDGWCGRYAEAQANLAAHFLTIATAQASGSTDPSAGVVSSVSADGVSISRAVGDISTMGQGAAYYNSTSYGQRYLQLLRICKTPVFTTYCP